MGANTPYLNLYLPSGGSSGDPAGDENYDVDHDNNNMRAIDTWAQGIGSAWQAWAPTVTSTGLTNVPTTSGRYIKQGKTVHGTAFVAFASSGNSGTGNYTMSLPVPAASEMSGVVIGNFWYAQTGGTIGSPYPLRGDGLALATFSGTVFSNTQAGSVISAHMAWDFTYESAS